jgi:hypothetical protein
MNLFSLPVRETRTWAALLWQNMHRLNFPLGYETAAGTGKQALSALFSPCSLITLSIQ